MSDKIEKSRDFASDCYEKITSALQRLGFKRMRIGVFAFEISPDVYGWLGLNRVRKSSTALELYPIVGVVHTQINEIILSSTSAKKDLSPSVSVPLCYLLSEEKYRTWTWRMEDDEGAVTSDLIKMVQQYGLPFIERFSTLEKIYTEFCVDEFGDAETRVTVNLQRVIPATMLLTNKSDLIEDYLQGQKHANDALGGDSDFDAFADRLMQRVHKTHH